MHKYLKKIEEIVDSLIPYCLILLLIIIVIELFFHETAELYHAPIEYADYFIIFIFVIDLIYKWFHVRKIPKFLKNYWLDIIAVFPFFLIFRLFEELSAIFALGETGQKILHEGLEIEKEVSKFEKEAARFEKEAARVTKELKATRATRFARFLRPIARLPRFAKAFSFYEHPKQRKKK